MYWSGGIRSNTAASVAITKGTPHAYNWYSLSLHASWPLSKLAGLKSLENATNTLYYTSRKMIDTNNSLSCARFIKNDTLDVLHILYITMNTKSYTLETHFRQNIYTCTFVHIYVFYIFNIRRYIKKNYGRLTWKYTTKKTCRNILYVLNQI